MRILLSNDDGYFAPGLAALADACKAANVDGLIVPDLPADHADEWLEALRPRGLGMAFIAAVYIGSAWPAAARP